MNHFRIGVVAQGSVNPSQERLVFPTAKGQKGFENWVGLEKGSGPWADCYQPVPLHMYWSPKNHYIRPDLSAFKALFDDYASGDCMGCHDEVTPGIVRSWEGSTHASLGEVLNLQKRQGRLRKLQV